MYFTNTTFQPNTTLSTTYNTTIPPLLTGPKEVRFKISEILTLLALTAILVIGILGNSLVIYVFGFNKKRRRRVSRFEGFLILLAVFDLLSSFVIPLAYMYLTATQYQQWHFGDTGCKIIPALLPISVTISQGVLIMISFERYHTLVKPFSRRISKLKVGFAMTSILTIGVLVSLPLMTTFVVVEDPAYSIKTCVPAGNKFHVLVGSAAVMLTRDLVALSVIAFLVYRTNHALTKQQETLTWKRKNLSKKSRQLLRTVITVFACLTLPISLFQLILYIVIHSGHILTPKEYEVVLALNTFFNLLQVSNSVVNVFIYSRMHSMFHLYCFAKPVRQRRKSSKWQSTSYEVTETEFLHVDGRRISRQTLPQNDKEPFCSLKREN